MQQPPLDLPFPRRRAMGQEDFIVGAANALAVAMVAGWRDWPQGRLALVGAAGSGKTHLVHVFMAETGAARIEARSLDPEAVPALVAAGAVALDDMDRLGEAPDPESAERAAFHLLNLAQARGAPVLVTGAEPPARWALRLPDLASRLRTAAVAPLALPDDDLLAAVIAKQFRDRHLLVEPDLPAFLVRRIERSFAAARAAVDRLDTVALAERRNVNRQLAAELFRSDRGPLDPASQTRHQ